LYGFDIDCVAAYGSKSLEVKACTLGCEEENSILDKEQSRKLKERQAVEVFLFLVFNIVSFVLLNFFFLFIVGLKVSLQICVKIPI